MSLNLHFSKSQLMSMRAGTALLRMIQEHGAPNSFAFSELVGRENAMLAGKAVKRNWIPFCLNVSERLPPGFESVRIHLSGGRIVVIVAEPAR